MSHYLEWSRAYSHRLNAADAAPLQARAAELGVRLERELAQGVLPFFQCRTGRRLSGIFAAHS